MSIALQAQQTNQEVVKALEAFESLLRNAIPLAEALRSGQDPKFREPIEEWIANAQGAIAKWGRGSLPVVVGSRVRVRPGFTYAGKSGVIAGQGKRPDGRVFYEVDLDIPRQSAGSPDREYYPEELVAL